MGKLTLALRELIKENLDPTAIIIGKNRLNARQARKAMFKADKEKHEAKLSLKKLILGAMTGDRQEVKAHFREMCTHFENQIKDDVDALEDLVQMTRREFLKLKELKDKEKGSVTEAQILRALKKFYDNSEKWFDLLKKRNSFTLYLEDAASKAQEVEHILDPLNIQSDIRKVDANFKGAKNAAKKKTAVQVEREKRCLSAFENKLDDEMKKLDLIWKDVIVLMQFEIEEFRKETKDIKSRLQTGQFPRADLDILDKEIIGAESDFNKSIGHLENQLNGLINIERTA